MARPGMRSSSPVSLLSLWISLGGCVPTRVESESVEVPRTPELTSREAAQLISQPGDSEPVPHTLVSLQVAPPVAGVVPVRFATTIRNRCQKDAFFVVDAADKTPDVGASNDRLGPGKAFTVDLADGECVHLQTAPDVYALRACEAGGWIVMTGDGPCTAIVGISR